MDAGENVLYLVLFFCGCFFVILAKRSNEHILFILLATVIIAIAVFRFGGGIDYFAYFGIYLSAPGDFSTMLYEISHGIRIEPLYLFIMVLAKQVGLTFPLFASAVSFFVLLFFFKTIRRASLIPLLSMVMFFGNAYLVYAESALRQGIALCFFLYGFCRFYKKGMTLHYEFCVLLAFLFHNSAVILFFVPLIRYISFKSLTSPVFILPMTIFLIFSSFAIPKVMGVVIEYVLVRYAGYEEQSFFIYALILRAMNLVIVLYLVSKVHDRLSEFDEFAIKVYIIGLLLYFLVSQISILSRLTEYFTVLEVIIVPNLIVKLPQKNFRWALKFFFLLVSFVLLIKDLASFEVLGGYKDTNPLDYPYITQFNKEGIRDFRDTNYDDEYFR